MLSEEFSSHSLWSQIGQSRGHVSELLKIANPDQTFLLNRINFIADYAETFSLVPPEYFTTNMLNLVSQSWTNVLAYLEQYVGNPNPSALTTACAQAENALDQVVKWPSPLSKGESLAQVTRTFRAYGAELEKSRNIAQEKTLEHAKTLLELETRFTQLSANLETASNDIKTQLSTLASQILAGEQRIEQALTKNNDAYVAAEKSRDLSLREWLLEQESNFSTLAQPSMDSIHKLLASADEAFSTIDQLRTDTLKVAGMATGDILATKYANSAAQERKTGLWALAGGWVGLLVGLIVYLLVFGGVVIQKLSWQAITLKFGFSAAIVGGATIAFKLGTRSLKLSSTYKRMELELRAIGPFLADVKDSDQTKKDFIDRAFGGSWNEKQDRKSSDELEETLLNKLLPRVLAALAPWKN